MDLKLQRRIRVEEESERPSLYKWCLQEVAEDDEIIGPDFIPWPYRLSFHGQNPTLVETLNIERDRTEDDQTPSLTSETAVLVNLTPEQKRRTWSSEPIEFQMLGTDRSIEEIQLIIRPLGSEQTEPACFVRGSVAYDFELDFRTERYADSLDFELLIPRHEYQRYSARVAAGECLEILLTVGMVRGFYAEWSPGVSTDLVKILTDSADHPVEIPDGSDREPFRLREGAGTVGFQIRSGVQRETEPPPSQEEQTDVEPLEREQPTPPSAEIEQMQAALERTNHLLSWLRVIGVIGLIILAILLLR